MKTQEKPARIEEKTETKVQEKPVRAAPQPPKIRVLLADDHQIVRQGLREMLEKESDLVVVGEAAEGREALRAAHELHPNVVVMDIGMPGLNGIEAARQLANTQPEIKVIGLSIHTERQFATEMLRAGAKAYLPKEDAFEELVRAIRAVIGGRVYLSPRVAGGVVDDCLGVDSGGRANAFAQLSPREREVLQLMAEGRATKEIAGDLSLSVKTVETHRRQIMEKLNLFSVAELTKYAIREGLTDVSR